MFHNIIHIKENEEKERTLSDRLWTSAARALLADVDRRVTFFSARDS